MNELKQEIKSRLLEKLDHSMEMEDEAVQEPVSYTHLTLPTKA